MEIKFYTVSEIADLLKVTPHRVYEAVRHGLLPAVHIGRQIRVEEKTLLRWIHGGGQPYAGGWRREAS